jgi:PhnB protein
MTVHELFPYLRVRDGEAAIGFYARAFGAEEIFRLTEPGGRLGHAEMKMGPAMLMLSEEFPEMGIVAPAPGTAAAILLHIHVDNADDVVARAVDLGAEIIRPLQDQFYGERSGTIRDPFGYEWSVGHAIEQLTPEEMQERYNALMSAG